MKVTPELHGIDEAGRGPVIGPLVICIFSISSSNTALLLQNGIKDSKLLSPSKRSELASLLKTLGSFSYSVIPPSEIDSWVRRKALNLLEIQSFAELSKGKSGYLFVDLMEKSDKRLLQYVSPAFSGTIIARHKADQLYPVVSAASILAKEKREELISKIKSEVGLDFGSGYPSDPKTKAALKNHLALLEPYIRKEWSTVKRNYPSYRGKYTQSKLFQ